MAIPWLYPGKGAWVFVSLPPDMSRQIRLINTSRQRGFGTLKVSVSIMNVQWQTSIFPDSKNDTYVLPLKKEIRQKCAIQIGKQVEITLRITA